MARVVADEIMGTREEETKETEDIHYLLQLPSESESIIALSLVLKMVEGHAVINIQLQKQIQAMKRERAVDGER